MLHRITDRRVLRQGQKQRNIVQEAATGDKTMDYTPERRASGESEEMQNFWFNLELFLHVISQCKRRSNENFQVAGLSKLGK